MLEFPRLVEIVVLSFLTAATISDLKKREVPNWVNYGLIAAGVGFSALHAITAADWRFLLYGVLGIGISLAFAALMFYTGQWGGGDSKLLVGLGVILGLPLSFAAPFVSLESPLVSFFSNLIIVSLFYAVFMGSILALKNREKFVHSLKEQAKSYSRLRIVVLVFAAVSLVAAIFVRDPFVKLSLVALVMAMLGSLYLSMMAKAVEKSAMVKLVSPFRLTEGDWIARDVFVDGKRICGPRDLGIGKRQISQLIAFCRKKKIRAVLVKEGIPFTPSFLIAYLATAFFGNLFLIVMR